MLKTYRGYFTVSAQKVLINCQKIVIFQDSIMTQKICLNTGAGNYFFFFLIQPKNDCKKFKENWNQFSTFYFLFCCTLQVSCKLPQCLKLSKLQVNNKKIISCAEYTKTLRPRYRNRKDFQSKLFTIRCSTLQYVAIEECLCKEVFLSKQHITWLWNDTSSQDIKIHFVMLQYLL